MVTRLNQPAKARKSLPLTERDLADLERLRGQPLSVMPYLTLLASSWLKESLRLHSCI